MILVCPSLFGAKPESWIERNYLVKGMFCGGCALGVKRALKAAGLTEAQILEVEASSPDPSNRLGHAKVKLSKELYQGTQTDCQIVKAIETHNPRLSVYWDPKNKKPCVE